MNAESLLTGPPTHPAFATRLSPAQEKTRRSADFINPPKAKRLSPRVEGKEDKSSGTNRLRASSHQQVRRNALLLDRGVFESMTI
jgi:hypothetical protein